MAQRQTFFVLLCLTLILEFVLSDNALSSVDNDGMFNKSLENCLKKNPTVTKEKAMQALASVFKEPVEQDVKCVLLCIGMDMGEMNGDGVIMVEKSLQNVPENVDKGVVKAIEEECMTLKGADKCETAFLQFKCIGEKAVVRKDDLMKKTKT